MFAISFLCYTVIGVCAGYLSNSLLKPAWLNKRPPPHLTQNSLVSSYIRGGANYWNAEILFAAYRLITINPSFKSAA